MPSDYLIGNHFEAFIKNQIRQGRYASASEVVLDGMRALEERDKLEALRKEIQRSEKSRGGVLEKADLAAVRKRVVQPSASRTGC